MSALRLGSKGEGKVPEQAVASSAAPPKPAAFLNTLLMTTLFPGVNPELAAMTHPAFTEFTLLKSERGVVGDLLQRVKDEGISGEILVDVGKASAKWFSMKKSFETLDIATWPIWLRLQWQSHTSEIEKDFSTIHRLIGKHALHVEEDE